MGIFTARSYAVAGMDTPLLRQKRIADLAKVAELTLLLRDETPSIGSVTAPETRRSGQRRNYTMIELKKLFAAAAVVAVLGVSACGKPAETTNTVDAATTEATNTVDAAVTEATNAVDAAATEATNAVDAAAGEAVNAVAEEKK